MKILGWVSLLVCAAGMCLGEIPEPENIIYGTIRIGGQPVTSANTGVVVEAVGPSGTVLDRYAMGSRSDYGEVFYVLRPQMESGTRTSTLNAQAGDTLTVVVRNGGSQVYSAVMTVTNRGVVTRMDFGAPVSGTDINANGMADDWETAWLGGGAVSNRSLAAPDADADGDGASNLREFLAGTDPLGVESYFMLDMDISTNNPVVRFTALKADGLGYAGMSRYYSLECATGTVGGVWSTVPGYQSVAGNNQSVEYMHPTSMPPAIYRGRVRLVSQ